MVRARRHQVWRRGVLPLAGQSMKGKPCCSFQPRVQLPMSSISWTSHIMNTGPCGAGCVALPQTQVDPAHGLEPPTAPVGAVAPVAVPLQNCDRPYLCEECPPSEADLAEK